MSAYEWLQTEQSDDEKRRILKEYVSIVTGDNPGGFAFPKKLHLFPTRRCNLNCKHCYVNRKGSNSDRELETGAILKLIERLRQAGLESVKISGGEPLLRTDFSELVRSILKMKLAVSVETNGLLLTQEIAEGVLDSPKVTVYISLDHCDAEYHDLFRGVAGSHERTLKSIALIGKLSCQSTVTTTANRMNLNSIPRLIDLVVSLGITKHRTLLNIHPLGSATNNMDLAIISNEMEQLVSTLLRTRHFQSGRAYCTLPPALTPLHMLKSVRTCEWGKSVIGLLSNGDISMCSASYGDSALIASNVFEDDILDIWQNAALFAKLRKISGGRVDGICGNCVLYPACRGMCRMSSYSHYRELDAPYPLCQHAYNQGKFPSYALLNQELQSYYGGEVIPTCRTHVAVRDDAIARLSSGNFEKRPYQDMA